MTPGEMDAAVASWSEAAARCALTPADHAAIVATRPVRALVVDLARRQGQDEELYDACSLLGRLLAEGGGSATLAALSIDLACDALGQRAPAWARPARAALAEGYARALIERTRQLDGRSWEFPGCAVPIDAGTVAIAAGHPSEDDETIASWAARTARAVVAAGYRRAVLAGHDGARAAVLEALSIAGIDVVE